MTATGDPWSERRRAIREAVGDLVASRPGPSVTDGAVTSDLSVDESLILHSEGWEPVELVCGAGSFSMPQGTWTWAIGEIAPATYAVGNALGTAARRLRDECAHYRARGVVGVRVDLTVERHLATAVLTGTAIVPTRTSWSGEPFVSDLGGRDFALLHRAGWEPQGLAFGVSYAYVPRRNAATAMRQAGQNVELTNWTRAMYSARESAMERMQRDAIRQQGSGVVAARVSEGPVHFASHAIGFVAWGTTVRAGRDGHRHIRPEVVLPLDDKVIQFEASHLR